MNFPKILPEPKSVKPTDKILKIFRLAPVFTKLQDPRILRETERINGLLPDGKTEITFNINNGEKENYTLYIESNGITVDCDSAKGAFYALQTLRQLISYGYEIPCCTVEDCPDFGYRGFYHDITRGRVPTLQSLKELVDLLALYKHNAFQVYVEHCFPFKEYDGIYQRTGYITPEEIKELDEYCRERFIDFIPSLSTFGHLYELLQSEKYRHLCELENYVPKKHFYQERMEHHTIDAYNPESFEVIKSLIDQYLPLFSSKYFNICCDETFDLCNSRNKGKDKAQTYLMFTKKIIEHVQSYGKTPMLWGDIVIKHPELLKDMPDDVIYLNWNYSPDPVKKDVEAFRNVNKTQIICPGVTAWSRIIEDTHTSVPNIRKTTEWGYECGGLGIMNTNWGDNGNACSMYMSLYGMICSGCRAWNIKSDIESEDFKNAVSFLYYGDKSGNAVKYLFLLAKYQYCYLTCDTTYLYSHNTVGSDYYPQLPEYEELKTAFEGCVKIISGIQNAVWDNENCRLNMLLAARLIKLFCSYRSVEKGEALSDFENEYAPIYKDFRTLWLKESKESELKELEKCFLAALQYAKDKR